MEDTKQFIEKVWRQNDKIESLITGKNKHSVYHYCIKHGFGIHMPFENKCPNCENETYLYISAEDVDQTLQEQQDRFKRLIEESKQEFDQRIKQSSDPYYSSQYLLVYRVLDDLLKALEEL